MSDRTDPSALAKAAADLAAVSAVSFEQARDALSAAARTELEQVAVYALEAVMRGDTAKATALVGQLSQSDRKELAAHVAWLRRVIEAGTDWARP